MVMPSSADMFRSAFDQVPDAIVISDDSGAVQFANQQVPALFGYSLEEILGQRVECLVPERARHRHAEARVRFTAARANRPMGSGLNLTARRKDGSELPVDISLGTIRHGEHTFVVAVIRDITTHHKLCRELSDLREAAARSSRAAHVAQEALTNARQASRCLLQSLSHSLRQPLQALFMLSGVLAGHSRIDEATLRHVDSIQSSAAGAITNLLESLFDGETAAACSSAVNACNLRASDTAPIGPAAPAVLVVLHDASVRDAARGLLRAHGYQVLTATNLKQAQEIARFRPDIGNVLTEQILGETETGADVIAGLRSSLDADIKAVLLCDDPVAPAASRIDRTASVRVARIPVEADQLLRMLAE